MSCWCGHSCFCGFPWCQVVCGQVLDAAVIGVVFAQCPVDAEAESRSGDSKKATRINWYLDVFGYSYNLSKHLYGEKPSICKEHGQM